MADLLNKTYQNAAKLAMNSLPELRVSGMKINGEEAASKRSLTLTETHLFKETRMAVKPHIRTQSPISIPHIHRVPS